VTVMGDNAGLTDRCKIVIKMLSNSAKSLGKKVQRIILGSPSPPLSTNKKNA
jgi:hypothetical protein